MRRDDQRRETDPVWISGRCAHLLDRYITIAGVIDMLEARGLLRPACGSPMPESAWITLTEKGRVLLGGDAFGACRAQPACFAPLSRSERGEFMRIWAIGARTTI